MITNEQAVDAVESMRLCRFFPSAEFQRAQIAAILIDMVGTKPELEWLVRSQSKLDWKGPYELRLLFSTRFRPQDTIGSTSDDDAERLYFEEQSQETDRNLAAWKREQKLLGESPVRIDLTPALNALTRTEEGVRRDRRHRSAQEALERL